MQNIEIVGSFGDKVFKNGSDVDYFKKTYHFKYYESI